jgi:hypothetical protein
VLSTRGPSKLEIVELILDGLSVAGLEGEDIVRHYNALREQLLALRDREVFFLGVDALLDAVGATVERRNP